jgi:hypothetical protein
MFSNLLLDLQDFKDRVRPLARDIALMDATRGYQKHNVNTLAREREALTNTFAKVEGEVSKELDEGSQSSRQLRD